MPQEERKEPFPAEKRTTAKVILVVEDDEDIGEFIASAISLVADSDYRLVPDASQALHFAKSIQPDLLILDYRLRGMHGLELYDHLHATSGLEAIPALLVTAVKLDVNLRAAIGKRQIIVVEKPFDLDEFLLTVQRLLGNRSG